MLLEVLNRMDADTTDGEIYDENMPEFIDSQACPILEIMRLYKTGITVHGAMLSVMLLKCEAV